MKAVSIVLFLYLPMFSIYSVHGQPCELAEDGNQKQFYWVYFTDKYGVDFNPYSFFDPKAIERRLRHEQDLYDTLDAPVSETYLSAVKTIVDSLNVVSRWLNAVNVFADSQQAESLKQLHFVKLVEPESVILLTVAGATAGMESFALTEMQLELVQFHTSHLKGESFADRGITGKGVRIAIFDTGFPGVDQHAVFKHIVDDDRIKATWNFFSKNPDVFRRNVHGTMVMSLIGGMIDELPMGLAPGSDYLLARTETWGEPFVEEKYWLAAAEWADKLGADIISSSLGYSYHRYFPDQMDGKTSLVAHAASIAVQKGILVVNAAGNDGERKSWKLISTPADVEGVLTVGALDFPTTLSASYSSRGPTSDGRIKPDVSALGNAFVAKARGFTISYGTSFACPLISGFAACVMQLHPDWTNMQVLDALHQSATLYPYHDLSHGYGVPQADYFFNDSVVEVKPTFDFIQTNDNLKVVIRHSLTEVAERMINNRYVYYHIRDQHGNIEQYFVAAINSVEVLTFDVKEFAPGKKLFVHLAGYTASYIF